MPGQLAKHGSDAGYRAELKTDNVCTRCRNAHRVYARQFRAQGRAQGLKYGAYEVIDHLYAQSGNERTPAKSRLGKASTAPGSTGRPAKPKVDSTQEQSNTESDNGSASRTARLLGEMLGNIKVSKPDNEYVPEEDTPDYLHPIDPDPEPINQEWAPEDSEYVINEAGMRVIEDNLGTYLSILGMTAEMIDPYCGRVFAENLDPMVKRWSKVIAHYPKAANLFLDSKGGIVFTWISAIQATWPVLYAIYEHHLARTVTTARRFNPPTFDATTPPMDGFEYSVR